MAFLLLTLSENMAPKLIYFPIKARAEPIRRAFRLSNIEFEDVHVTFEEFGKKKAEGAYRFGAVPVLVLEDGSQVTQSTAILRWVGKQGGLYPTDLLASLHADEVMDAIEDFYGAISPTMQIKDEEEKLAKRKELAEGRLPLLLKGLSELAQRNGDNGYFVGSSTTVADLKAVALLGWLTSGMLDGVPTSLVDAHPNLVKILETNNE